MPAYKGIKIYFGYNTTILHKYLTMLHSEYYSVNYFFLLHCYYNILLIIMLFC